MEAGILQFDPASEFEIIETFEFEEEIQRPEEMRFFTLDEQLNDYNEKVLPKKAKITKFEYEKIAEEIDRIRELYEEIITTTDVGYTVDTKRKSVLVDWVSPIYSDFQYSPYSFAESWNPLYSRENVRIPNFYPRLLTAIPKPYRSTGTSGVAVDDTIEVVDESGLNRVKTLGTYQRTKGVIHEDGTFDVIKLPMLNTKDDMKRKGYYIFPRKLEVPNPLENHPFLSSSQEGKLLTEEELNDVFPSIEAIVNHGVPRTSDPYGEGKKFLKIYDVKLSQVPWYAWKAQFPPVDTIVAAPQVISVKFPDKEDEPEPSKSLREFYVIPWYPGLNPRFWLTKQEDGGAVVSKMLLSKAGESGNVPPTILSEKPVPSFPSSTPEDCLQTSTFQELLDSGIYRNGVCVPANIVMQERSDALSNKSLSWKETTGTEILKEYKELLSFFQVKPSKDTEVKYEKYAGKPVSELRKDIVTILDDPHRMASDKAEAIQLLLRETKLQNEIFTDKDESFILCNHTLSVLNGDLITDRLMFYDKWSAIEEGYRVCKYCGELINTDVLVAQDDFDDDGNVIINYDVISSSNVFHGDAHIQSFTNSLLSMKPLFDLNVAGEAILYLLLSLLQILPEETQLVPVLGFIRELSAVIRMNKKIEKDTKERLEGLMGIVGTVVLLQTHNPFLVPRRSFGTKALKLTGFPRDTDDSSDSPTLDLVITVLRRTVQESPSTFKGAVGTFLRSLISKPKDVRKESIVFLKRAADKFKTQFVNAKERYVSPSEDETVQSITFPIVPVTKTTYTPSEKIGDEIMAECIGRVPIDILLSKLPPNVKQQPVPLEKTNVSPDAEQVIPELIIVNPITVSETEIRKRVGLGFPKGLKLAKLEDFLKREDDGVAILTLTGRILDILSKENYDTESIAKYREYCSYLKPSSLLRDSAKGILYELLHEISKNTGMVNALSSSLQRDIVTTMIFLTKEQATRQDMELRAKERETFKQRMRQMDDTQREATKLLLDIGISDYIITNQDRELFMKEYNLPDPDLEYDKIVAENDLDRPEDNPAGRDVEDDLPPLAADGTTELDADRGEYGDRREYAYGRDYETFGHFDDEEGYGV